MTNEELLGAYAEELGIRSTSLSTLIDSHRYLRSLNLERMDLVRDAIATERERAYADAKEYALKHEWVSVKRLKAMSVQELVDFLSPF